MSYLLLRDCNYTLPPKRVREYKNGDPSVAKTTVSAGLRVWSLELSKRLHVKAFWQVGAKVPGVVGLKVALSCAKPG